MKKLFIIVACALLFSCAKEEKLSEQHARNGVKTYTLSISAERVRPGKAGSAWILLVLVS